LSDWLSLDSKLARSLRELIRPGRLSELYVGGKRAPFLRPFRLYLVASLVLFSTVLTLDTPDPQKLTLTIGGKVVGAEASGPVTRSLSFLAPDSFASRQFLALAGDRVDRLESAPPQEVLEAVFTGLRRVLPSGFVLFVPFLAVGLKLLYLRGRARRTLYLEHLVFALHYQSALFLAVAGAWAVARLSFGDWRVSALSYALAFLVMLVVYLPMALRRFYRQSWWWTAVKAVALLFVYVQLLGLVVDFATLVGIWRV
jgi:hypothetical protein